MATAMSRPVRPARHSGWEEQSTVIAGKNYPFCTVGNPNGRQAILLNGWFAGPRAYRGPLEPLAEAADMWIAALPNAGAVGTSGPSFRRFGFRPYASRIMKAIRQLRREGFLRDEPLYVMGHSFGGGVAVQLACDFPDEVIGVIPLNGVGAKSVLRTRGWSPKGFVVDMKKQADVLARDAKNDVLKNLRHPGAHLHMFGTFSVDRLYREYDRLAEQDTYAAPYFSENDGILKLDIYQEQCRRLGTEPRIMPGGHTWFAEYPELFVEAMTKEFALADAHVRQRATMQREVKKSFRPAGIERAAELSLVREA